MVCVRMSLARTPPCFKASITPFICTLFWVSASLASSASVVTPTVTTATSGCVLAEPVPDTLIVRFTVDSSSV